MKRVLIAHQSSIPPYRVAFYEALERLRGDRWQFTVVYDALESANQGYAQIDRGDLSFPVMDVRSLSVGLGSRRVVAQDFLGRASGFDLLVVGNEVRNLSYPAALLWRLAGKPVACWGHGRDRRTPSALANAASAAKLFCARRASGYFAYTEGSREYLASQGVAPETIFRLDNTIDIQGERQRFASRSHDRVRLRRDLGLGDEKVLLFVGRLQRRKGLDFLAAALASLRSNDASYRLMVVGEGDRRLLGEFDDRAVLDLGPLTGEALADVYVASDLYVFPGVVGLGPLQALCYDLVPVVVDATTHCPEYEYLSPENAVICPQGSSPEDFAAAIAATFEQPDELARRRSRAWSSIEHLKIDAMAANFAAGVDELLRRAEA